MPLVPPTRTDQTGLVFLQYYAGHKVYHPGIDFNWGPLRNSDLGQPVVAPASGSIVYVSPRGTNGGLGNYVVLYHPAFRAWTRYLHLEEVAVRAGQQVKQGQMLGLLGDEGTTSAHLHFEVLNEKGFNWIRDWRRPYGRYPEGLPKAAVASMWLDPVRWLRENTERSPEPTSAAGRAALDRAAKRRAKRIGR